MIQYVQEMEVPSMAIPDSQWSEHVSSMCGGHQ